MPTNLQYDHRAISAFCERWDVVRMWLFGSAVRDDFTDKSDVDIMVSIASDSSTCYWHWVDMMDELRAIFGRDVDLIADGPIKNPFRRQSIMADLELIYER